ncbi:PhoX domain-containing protein [Artomyces pyxidatus]|uniref:PhoX domain-containing protein n=1 Tax=Artomyces pyxidatus TaxID=48021 RepID=A0ACB8STB7_9AGAM|nr:PhoX domain-containing protein [Artomyces pyxidatus]
MQAFSMTDVVLVAALSIFLPIVFRTISSPLTLILLSPFILLFLVVSLLGLNLLLGYILDTRRRSQGPSVVTARPLAFSTPAAWQVVLTRSQWSYKPPQTLPPIYPDSPMISSAVNDILILIVRDFVLTWYKDISSSPSFPTAVSSTLHSSLERLLTRLSSADLPTIFVKRILPKITAHVEQFRESEIALRGAGLERRLTESEELDILLASRYAGKGGNRLHPAVNNLSSSFTKQTEENHLKQLVEKVLPYVLPEKEARSQALKVVVREIASCSVFYPVMDMFADPDFWNRTIGQLAGAAIRQQRLITKVRNVLEAQLPNPKPRLATPRSSVTDTITIRTDARQFESFLRSISRTSSLLDARRLKSDIMGEIRRTRMLLANHEREDWINGEKTEDVVAFLDRLYTAKRRAEQRIAILGGNDDTKLSVSDTPTPSRLTLRDILGNPSSLSYLMEFMDRRNRSLLVQFWLTVESFKNPLEAVESGSSDEEEEIHDHSHASTAKEDITMIYELYFSGSPHPALSAISPKHASAIRGFVVNETEHSPSMERKARRSVMLAQRQVEQAIEQDFEDFERSELWFRVVEDINASRGATGHSPSLPSGHGRTKGSPSITDSLADGGQSRLPLSPAPMMTRSESLPSFVLPPSVSILSLRVDQSSPTSPSEPPRPVPVRSSPSNLDVLMSPLPEPDSVSNRAPLFDDPDDRTKDTRESQSTVEAIQAALTDIIALDNKQTDKRRPFLSATNSLFDVSPELPGSQFSVATTHNSALDDIDEDEEKAEDRADAKQENFQLAGPGDLQLSYEIERLSDKISTLQTQDAMLDTLIKKAELTGDAQELRLLRRSKSAMTREFRELSFQRTQYEQQETANRLVPERTKLTIVNSVVGDEHGKSVVRYLVEVQQLAPDGSIATGWVVARRYNEFLNMHNKLRERYAAVRSLDFPGKRLVTSLAGSFVDTRRAALEKYMQSIVLVPAVCESDELRSFLSRHSPFIVSEPEGTSAKSQAAFPGTGLVRNMYHSVAESIDDMFFGPSMLDVMIQRLTRQAAELAGIVGSSVNDEDVVAQALRASGKTTSDDTLLQFSGDLKPLEGETSSSAFSAPICDLVLAIFELNKKNNWLRRQAIVIIMQQVLGSTVERKLRETISYLTDELHIMNFINIFRDSLWSGGQLRSQSVPRSAEEKLRTRDDANRMLSALMPDLAANMIGRSNARRGARRIFAVLQNRRLNQHIAYTIVDEVRP